MINEVENIFLHTDKKYIKYFVKRRCSKCLVCKSIKVRKLDIEGYTLTN